MAKTKIIETLPVEPLLLRAEQAAALCNLSVSTWYEYRAAGRIPPSVKIGKARFWRLAILRLWCELDCPPLDKFREIVRAKEST
ncbi:MAG TPA: hypothetical protein DIU00_18600 [Phycisphaerales bacterium]|nr:hypothetical protein [Phycisphaerales bacterium]